MIITKAKAEFEKLKCRDSKKAAKLKRGVIKDRSWGKLKAPDFFVLHEKNKIREDFDEYIDKETWVSRLYTQGVRVRQKAIEYWKKKCDASGHTYRKIWDRETKRNVMVVPMPARVGVQRATKEVEKTTRTSSAGLRRSNAFLEEPESDAHDSGKCLNK